MNSVYINCNIFKFGQMKMIVRIIVYIRQWDIGILGTQFRLSQKKKKAYGESKILQ